MNTMEMVEENICIASETKAEELSSAELELYDKVCQIIMGKGTMVFIAVLCYTINCIALFLPALPDEMAVAMLVDDS